MTAEPLRHVRIADQIVEALLRWVSSGELRPGDRLPAERELAAQLGVSRTSLRGAVQQLALLGHLEVRPGDGTFVRRPGSDTVARPFRELLRAAPSAAADLLEFRLLLEPDVAALAALRVTAQGAARLRASLERQRQLRGADFSAEDIRFHSLTAQLSGNTVVLEVLDTLRATLRGVRLTALPAMQEEQTRAEHQRIADAICAGDAQAARRAMTLHLEDVTETYRRATGSGQEQDEDPPQADPDEQPPAADPARLAR